MAFLSWWQLITSLMIREVHCRFAGGALGYIWTFVTPVAWIVALVVSFDFLGREPGILADVPSFVATGMLPYVIFRQTVTSMGRTMATSRSLVHLGPLTISDTLFAAAVLELLNAIVIFSVIFLIIGVWYGFTPIADPLLVLGGVFLALLLGASFGRLAAVLIQLSDAAARIIPIALRPLFWISGIFFTAAELSGELRDILWFNPLLHVIEILRSGYFADYTSRFADISVIVFAAGGFYFASLLIQHAAVRNVRGQMLT